MKNIASVKFIIGVGRDRDGNNLAGPDGGQPEPGSEADTAINRVLKFVADEFGGYTKTTGRGGWQNDNLLLEEPVVIIEAAITNPWKTESAIRYSINKIVRMARQSLNQECILVQKIYGYSSLE